MQLPKNQRIVTFYSEGKNYWPYLEGLIHEFLKTSNIPICYISSGEDDPGLFIEHCNYRAFKIDDKSVRNWLFANIDTSVMVMTMPDLQNYQVKRSKHKVHYIYIQHSLVSLHMAYRHGAFDWFDTVFCAGPHHTHEIRCLEEKYNLPPKKIFEHGYVRLDLIINNKQSTKAENLSKHALFAPSWGNNAAIETGYGDLVIKKLLSFGYKVTLRPHPETLKTSSKIINTIVNKYSNNKLFIYENGISSLDSFYQSDFMISDWSGAALEYSFGLNKPVIFLDLPKKINNPSYKDIDVIPLEVSIREDIGVIASVDDITPSLITSLPYGKVNPNKYVFNVGKSDFYGVKYILDMMDTQNE